MKREVWTFSILSFRALFLHFTFMVMSSHGQHLNGLIAVQWTIGQVTERDLEQLTKKIKKKKKKKKKWCDSRVSHSWKMWNVRPSVPLKTLWHLPKPRCAALALLERERALGKFPFQGAKVSFLYVVCGGDHWMKRSPRTPKSQTEMAILIASFEFSLILLPPPLRFSVSGRIQSTNRNSKI